MSCCSDAIPSSSHTAGELSSSTPRSVSFARNREDPHTAERVPRRCQMVVADVDAMYARNLGGLNNHTTTTTVSFARNTEGADGHRRRGPL